jgi:signal transduction histidine kinase/integral membrane sensor domain MASE1
VTRSNWPLTLGGLCLVYVLAGKLGLQFASVHASSTPLWPPTGIALAAFLLQGHHVWPAIFIGAFVVNVTTAGSPATSLGIAVGNTLEGLVGAWLVQRWANGRQAFMLPQTIFIFALGAGFVATAVSATIGVTSLVLGGYAPWTNFARIWLTWWLGDAAGALVVAPLLIVWANESRLAEFHHRWAEAIGLGLVTVFLGIVVFGGAIPMGTRDAPLAFLCLPSLVWAAYRFGPRGAATALMMLATIAAMGTLLGHGPFATGNANDSLLLLQAFLVTVSATVLPLAALAEELARRAARSAENARLYRESEGRRRTAEAFADTGRALVESLDMREVANRIVASVRELLGGTTTIVFQRDPATGSHTALATAGDGGSEFVGLTIPAGAGAIGLAVRDLRPVVTRDVTADPRITLTPEIRVRVERTPMRAVVAVPLVAQGRVIGAFLVGDRAGRVFTPEEIVVAEAFAHHAALAIDNARLYEEAQQARRAAEAVSHRSAFLAEAGVIISSTLDSDVIFGRVAELAVPRTADWCAVFLQDRGGPIGCVTFYHREPAKTEKGRRYITAQPVDINAPYGVAKVIRTGVSDLVPNVSDEMIRAVARDEEGVRIRLEIGHRSIMTVPLHVDDSLRGAMVFGRAIPNAYDATDVALAEDLARRVALAMQNAHLYRQTEEARADAETANRAKDAFLAVLSHELRTPLNSVAGWIRMLESGTVGGMQTERALASVGRNVSVLRRLIDDLLDVSRIVTGKLTLERNPCDLGTIIEQTIESFGHEAETKDLRVKADLERGLVVEADALRLRQIIGNLVSNAIKFTPSGGDVFVTLRRERDHAVLTVADTGSGIPSDALPHIFERFRQADSSSTRRYGGLGLGLAIVRHLVELHGGTVRAENRDAGRGAIVTVELPLGT